MNKNFAIAVAASALGLFLGNIAYSKYQVWQVTRANAAAK